MCGLTVRWSWAYSHPATRTTFHPRKSDDQLHTVEPTCVLLHGNGSCTSSHLTIRSRLKLPLIEAIRFSFQIRGPFSAHSRGCQAIPVMPFHLPNVRSIREHHVDILLASGLDPLSMRIPGRPLLNSTCSLRIARFEFLECSWSKDPRSSFGWDRSHPRTIQTLKIGQ